MNDNKRHNLSEDARQMLTGYCNEYKSCSQCPLKKIFPDCGNGWHIAFDGSYAMMKAAVVFFTAVEALEELKRKKDDDE